MLGDHMLVIIQMRFKVEIRLPRAEICMKVPQNHSSATQAGELELGPILQNW